MNKRIIAAVLCILLLLSIIPFALFAEEAASEEAQAEEVTTEKTEVEEPAPAEEVVEAEAEVSEQKEETEAIEDSEEIDEIEKPKAGVVYPVTVGQNSKYTTKQGNYAHFGCKAKMADYTGIKIDGKSINAWASKGENDTCVVHLKPEYMDTLSVGAHTCQLFFVDGESEIINFTVERGSDPYGNPSTGDNENALLWAVLAVLSLGGIAVSAVILKKEH